MFLLMDSSSSAAVLISPQEFKLFHEMDRKLYTLLAIELWRDPLLSMRIIALWLWLERSGFTNVVKKILSLPHFLINELADEAVTCLNYIYLKTNPFGSIPEPVTIDIPLTQNLMDKDISLHFFRENRPTATQGISRIVNEVCVKALADIMEEAVEKKKKSVARIRRHVAETQMLTSSSLVPQDRVFVDPDGRTMFATFSKGYPVAEREIVDFFTRSYGQCIESLRMQEVQPSEQPLFARIVFFSISTIEMILDGDVKAKFTINGKHVWMRKFVPKRRRSSSPPPPTPLPPPLLRVDMSGAFIPRCP